METDKPIQIPEEKVIEAAQAGMDEFLKVFTDAYWERIGGSLTAETMPLLTGEQHVFLGYQIFVTKCWKVVSCNSSKTATDLTFLKIPLPRRCVSSA